MGGERELLFDLGLTSQGEDVVPCYFFAAIMLVVVTPLYVPFDAFGIS